MQQSFPLRFWQDLYIHGPVRTYMSLRSLALCQAEFERLFPVLRTANWRRLRLFVSSTPSQDLLGAYKVRTVGEHLVRVSATGHLQLVYQNLFNLIRRFERAAPDGWARVWIEVDVPNNQESK